MKTTEMGEYYTKGVTMSSHIKIQCKWLQNKDLEIRTLPAGKAWIGVTDVNEDFEKNIEKMVEIKRHIRHAESYHGGGTYGKYGGHDITLIELKKPLTGKNPACIPGPKFDDIHLKQKNSILAGYGKYLRSVGETCETNKYGQMKMHYCDKMHGAGSSACITDEPPPIDEECKKFYNSEGTPSTFSDIGKEFRIQAESGEDITVCYPSKNPANETYGWCKTNGNYYDLDNYELEKEGWGFCSKDCYLDTKVKNSGILREKLGVEILSEDLCEKYLNRSLYSEDGIEVMPRILCVARTEKWAETTWVKTGEGYKQIENSGPVTRYGTDSYVASVGTCQGDSGGPVFVEEEKDRYVVTGEELGVCFLYSHHPCLGVVSGGRGELGECGGINNPIHYVR